MEIQNPPITLRPATPKDLSLLQGWDKQPHVLDATSDSDWEWETELHRNPAWREQLIAELNGRPLGFMQIIDPALEESHYWGDVGPNLRALDIWIAEAKDLGKGYGSIMMKIALQRCFDQPEVTAVIIDPLISNVRAHRFYERLGFEFVKETMLEDELIRMYQMNRKKWAVLKP